MADEKPTERSRRRVPTVTTSTPAAARAAPGWPRPSRPGRTGGAVGRHENPKRVTSPGSHRTGNDDERPAANVNETSGHAAEQGPSDRSAPPASDDDETGARGGRGVRKSLGNRLEPARGTYRQTPRAPARRNSPSARPRARIAQRRYSYFIVRRVASESPSSEATSPTSTTSTSARIEVPSHAANRTAPSDRAEPSVAARIFTW